MWEKINTVLLCVSAFFSLPLSFYQIHEFFDFQFSGLIAIAEQLGFEILLIYGKFEIKISIMGNFTLAYSFLKKGMKISMPLFDFNNFHKIKSLAVSVIKDWYLCNLSFTLSLGTYPIRIIHQHNYRLNL